MLTADKVTELFCMADDFCKFFDKMTAKYTLKSNMKGALMSVSDKCCYVKGLSLKLLMMNSRILHKWSTQGIAALTILS